MTRSKRTRREWIGLGLLWPCLALAEPVESLQRIEAVAIAAVAAQLPPSARVSGGGLDPRVRLPECADTPSADPPQLRGGNATVAVRCSAPAWTLYVPLQISDLRPVVVLARAAARGATIDEALIDLQVRDVSRLPFGYFESAAALRGHVLRRPLAAGTVLTANDAEPPRLVRRGESVTVIGRSGGLEVRASGTALADGAQGSRVKVRNDTSKRVVEGVVTAAGTVEIAF
ncbi:flagellar basal body P-ring formation chaperone FlgA [Fontimonas sp. SYSU GA230001]|uniref:flagellar basal body P-ring formation chaperone FlgA n=1 Tax=Fontimonas sp. SYSU GA230001 TaxID=3142450 RepID=UPI0032B5B6EB